MAYLRAQFCGLSSSYFIKDLPLNIRGAKVLLFADDINLLITGKDECLLQQKITKVMREVESWFQKNNLIINTEKTNQCRFTPNK
jgi:hypothetical protein